MDLNKKSIIFVCTGNTCRSPMAEYLLKDRCSRAGLNVDVSSHGLFVSSRVKIAGRVYPYVSPEARIVMKEINPNSQISGHNPSQLYSSHMGAANLVLTMEESQRNTIIRNYRRVYGKELAGKIFTLKEYAGFTDEIDIEDPLMLHFPNLMRTGSVFRDSSAVSETEYRILEGYRNCRDEIKSCLERILGNPEPDIDALLANRKKSSGFGKLLLDFLVGEN